MSTTSDSERIAQLEQRITTLEAMIHSEIDFDTAATILDAGRELTPGQKIFLAWQMCAGRRYAEGKARDLARSRYSSWRQMPDHLLSAAEAATREQEKKEAESQALRNEATRQYNAEVKRTDTTPSRVPEPSHRSEYVTR